MCVTGYDIPSRQSDNITRQSQTVQLSCRQSMGPADLRLRTQQLEDTQLFVMLFRPHGTCRELVNTRLVTQLAIALSYIDDVYQANQFIIS
jgi:hypothetical protein